MTAVTIRRVRPPEHTVVGQVLLDAYDAVGRIEGEYRTYMADTAGRVREGAEVWVGVPDDAEGPVLGTVTFADAGSPALEHGPHADCGFRLLAVAPSAQGQGVGRCLVQACVDAARDRDRRRLMIYSMEWMATAHGMYAAMGFARRPDRDVTFPSGVGLCFQLDLVADADAHFPPPGEVPDTPPWYLDAWTG